MHQHCRRGAKTAFQREMISFSPSVWIPFEGPNPYRCRVTGLSLTPGASLQLTGIAGGRSAVLSNSTDTAGATFTTLNGLTTVSVLAWIYRPGGTWADGKCCVQWEWFQTTGRGLSFDARTTNTSIEAGKTNSGGTYFIQSGSASTPTGRWCLIVATTDLNSTTAPSGYIDGTSASLSGSNNGYTAGTMDASAVFAAGSTNGCQMRDLFLLNQELTAQQVARLSALDPYR